MKLKTLIVTAVIAGAALTGTAQAQTLKLDNASSLTDGLVQDVAKRDDYYRCASFSLKVLNACVEQANRQGRSTRPCRQHYQSNIVRCQALRRK